MTKKDYELIASVIRQVRYEAQEDDGDCLIDNSNGWLYELTEALSEKLKEDNRSFDKHKFVSAATP